LWRLTRCSRAPLPRMATHSMGLDVRRESLEIPVLDAAQARMKPGGSVVKPLPMPEQHREPIAGFHTDPRLRRLVRSRSGRANAPRPCQPSRRSRSRLPALLGRTGHWWRRTGAAAV